MAASDPEGIPNPEQRADGRVALRFPREFTWGCGLSAHQVEGGNANCDWWEFEQTGAVANGEVSGRATDHYNRFAEDFRIARDLHQRAVKLSVEWARIEPEPGRYSEEALGHYENVVEMLRSLGIEPWVVLHHFTSPRWLAHHEWWEGHKTVELFAAYSQVVAERLAPWVKWWVPVNEPAALAAQGYLTGMWPPGIKGGVAKAREVGERLVDAHRMARAAIQSVRPDARVGVAVNSTAVIAGEDSRLGKALHRFVDYMTNWWYLDRVRADTDFVGLQYYSRVFPEGLLSGSGLVGVAGPEGTSDMGWPIFSEGLFRMARETWRRYGLPVYVTENGLADAKDERRAEFIINHLAWLHRAMRNGADVRGYFHWALTDNFEWLEGFSPRFGLLEVDYATLSRRVRRSALAYAEICRTGTVPVVPDHPSLESDS